MWSGSLVATSAAATTARATLTAGRSQLVLAALSLGRDVLARVWELDESRLCRLALIDAVKVRNK